ncbi:Ankyrin-3 [Fusarium oxysporum f. sp. albedinis]|nr:Ankyrin-3 [Fusarium oxysporum f. sp. albedinis]
MGPKEKRLTETQKDLQSGSGVSFIFKPLHDILGVRKLQGDRPSFHCGLCLTVTGFVKRPNGSARPNSENPPISDWNNRVKDAASLLD